MSLVAFAFAALLSQSVDFSVDASRLGAPPGASFRAAFAENINGVWATEFYIQSTGEGPNFWRVRRSLMTMGGREREAWATEAECPVVRDVAESLSHLQLGTLAIPETGRTGPRRFEWPSPGGPSVPGGSYLLWGTGAGGAAYRVNAPGGPIADWVQAAELAMADCWSKGTAPLPDGT